MDDPPELINPSKVDAWYQAGSLPANPDSARIFVQLSNGTKLLVLVNQSSTVQHVHKKALSHARKFGITTDLDHSFLQTTGSAKLALCGDDLLRDVSEVTENATLALVPLQDHLISPTAPVSVTALPSDESTDDDKEFFLAERGEPPIASRPVHIRLITLKEAIMALNISSINTNTMTVPDSLSLEEFQTRIAARYNQRSSTGKIPKVNLYLRQCRLATKNNPMTLKELNLHGSMTQPLDVFVDIDQSDPNVTVQTLQQDTSLKSLWGFQTTRRGICTLHTSLIVLLRHLSNQTGGIENLLTSVFRLTHFPPLLIALKLLSQHGGFQVDVDSLRMMASAMQILCLKIAPGWASRSSETALESSRQVLAYIYSLRGDEPYDVNTKKLLLPTTLHYKNDKKELGPRKGYHQFEVNLSIRQEDSPEILVKNMVVEISADDKDLASLLGRAINQSYNVWADYYLDLDDEWSAVCEEEKDRSLQIGDFDVLLQTTAASKILRMVSPDKIGACLSIDLPVVTLNANGHVSVYDQEDYQCTQRFFTWSAVDGKEIMTKGSPGQYLMQKLEPIIAERKDAQTWRVDAWAEWTEKAEFGAPDEAIVVCMDTSASMGVSMPAGWIAGYNSQTNLPSRLTEVKEFFKNFASRISAMQLATYLGLVTFSSKTQISMKQDLTPIHLNFEDQIDNVEAQSQTAIFDALYMACNMLCKVKAVHQDTKCRIILLTDGEDNDSFNRPFAISQKLYENDIVLDSIVIGSTAGLGNLFKISSNTGGYAFAPADQQMFFQIFLLETVTDIRTRPDIVRVTILGGFNANAWTAFKPKARDMATQYSFPPCRPHPNQNDYFVSLHNASKSLYKCSREGSVLDAPSVYSGTTQTMASTVTGTTLSSVDGNSRLILNEISEMIKHPHPQMDIYVSESNMGFWKVAMQGPPNSPYAAGVFLLYIDIGPQFPLSPPSARFITPVLHPNITKSQDAIDPLFSLKFWTNPQQGRTEVKRYVDWYATKPRATIRQEIMLGSETPVSSSAASILSYSDDRTLTSRTPPSSSPPSYRSNVSSNSLTRKSLFGIRRSLPPLMSMSRNPGEASIDGTSTGVNTPTASVVGDGDDDFVTDTDASTGRRNSSSGRRLSLRRLLSRNSLNGANA